MLEGGNAIVALYNTDAILRMYTLQIGDATNPELLDKRMCSALARNPAVMTPLVRFFIANVSETPSTDLEFVAIRMFPILSDLFRSADMRVATSASTLLPPGR